MGCGGGVGLRVGKRCGRGRELVALEVLLCVAADHLDELAAAETEVDLRGGGEDCGVVGVGVR